MSEQQKEAAARNIVKALYEGGCIDNKEKYELEHRLNVGDRIVYRMLRVYLIKLATDINDF